MDLDKHLDILEKSPLAQLSIASSELFHSNFLYWLCWNHSNFAHRVLKKCLGDKMPDAGISSVIREKKNIDLWIETGAGPPLLIENKLKSLPNREQLDRYQEKNAGLNPVLVLLSIATATFFKNGSYRNWHLITYNELRSAITETLAEPGNDLGEYEKHLVNDYTTYLEALVEIHSWSQIQELDSPFLLEEEDLEKLGRFRSMVLKWRYYSLAEKFRERFSDPLHQSFSTFTLDNSTPLMVNSGMTRGRGLFDFKYLVIKGGEPPKDSIFVGIQIQGDDFRLVVEQVKGKAEPFADKLLDSHLWFNFELAASICEDTRHYPRGKSKRFNKFGDSFRSQGRKLKSKVTPNQIISTIDQYRTCIENSLEEIQKTISTVGGSN